VNRPQFRAVEDPSLERRRLALPRPRFREPFHIPFFNDFSPPEVPRTIANDRQQPARQQRPIDRVQVAMKRQKRLGRQVFRRFPLADDAHGKSKDGLDVLTIDLLECLHLNTDKLTRPEDLQPGVANIRSHRPAGQPAFPAA